MKSDLAIAALIRSRMTELGLSRGEFAKRLRYKNVAKGIRRIDALCARYCECGQIAVDEVPNRLIAGVVPELIATVIVVAVSEYVRELAQRDSSVRFETDIVRIIKFMCVPESAAHLNGRLFRSDVITLGYRSSSLQVQLRAQSVPNLCPV